MLLLFSIFDSLFSLALLRQPQQKIGTAGASWMETLVTWCRRNSSPLSETHLRFEGFYLFSFPPSYSFFYFSLKKSVKETTMPHCGRRSQLPRQLFLLGAECRVSRLRRRSLRLSDESIILSKSRRELFFLQLRLSFHCVWRRGVRHSHPLEGGREGTKHSTSLNSRS